MSDVGSEELRIDGSARSVSIGISIVTTFKGKSESGCVRLVSRKDIKPTHHPSIMEGCFISGHWYVCCEAVGTLVFVGKDVNEFEVKLEGGSDPVTDSSIWLGVRIVKHTFSVACVHLHYEVADADEMEMQHPKCVKEAVDFEFGLGVAGLMFTLGDGAKARGAAVAIETVLRKGVWREAVNLCG